METRELLKEKVSTRPYECPEMEVFFVGVWGVICGSDSDSDTEHVGENEGEW